MNFVMDLFQQRVEQSHVMGASDLVLEVLDDPNFGVIEEIVDDLNMIDSEQDLGLGFSFELKSYLEGDNSCRFLVDDRGTEDDGDDFFAGRRISVTDLGEAPSTVSGPEPFANCVQIVGVESDLGEEQNDIIMGIDLHSEDEYGLDHLDVDTDNDDDTSIHLCWDSLQLDDHREIIEDFEWEEVDGQVEEREVFSVFDEDDDDEGSVSVTLGTEPEEVLHLEGVFRNSDNMGNLEWQVLLNSNNLERNLELDHGAEPSFGDHDGYIYPAEYDMLFGQFTENVNALMGCPPASRTIVQNLPSVVLTQGDVENNNALCAVCKDDISIGEQVKQLPCAHRYHGDCIVPWLGIRNTCPVCRYELPTDDAEYERRRTQGAR